MRTRFVQRYVFGKESPRRPVVDEAETDVVTIRDRWRKEFRVGVDGHSGYFGFPSLGTLAVKKGKLTVVLREHKPDSGALASCCHGEGPRTTNILRRLGERCCRRKMRYRQQQQCAAESQ